MPGQKLLCWDSISTFNENDLSGKDMFTKRLKVIKFMGMVMVALMAVSCVDSLNTSPIDDNVVTSKDRKSTRLNSSHVAISYAVFCLKKKKTQMESNLLHREQE